MKRLNLSSWIIIILLAGLIIMGSFLAREKSQNATLIKTLVTAKKYAEKSRKENTELKMIIIALVEALDAEQKRKEKHEPKLKLL